MRATSEGRPQRYLSTGRAAGVLLAGALSLLPCGPALAEEVTSAAAADVSVSRTWPIELSAMADSFGFAPGAPHPLFSLGTEIPWDNRGVFRLAQAVQFEYRAQPGFLHGPGVGTKLLIRVMANVGFFAEAGLGVGYFMGFLGPTTWVLDPATGEFVKGGSGPRSMFKASLGLAIGMDLSVRWNVPLRIAFGYDEALLFNVGRDAGYPILPAPAYGLRLAWFFGGAR